MTLEEVKERFPALAVKLPENIFTDRELVVVDHNYEEVDGEETAEFDPSEFSHIVYIATPMLEIIGAKGLALLTEKLEGHEIFSHFVAAEEDLFGVQSDLDEDEIAKAVFSTIEEVIS
jgi:hypothetical protein